MKRYILVWIWIVMALPTFAQRITVTAPARVAAGENFRIAYTVDTKDVEDFRVGSIPSALEVIAGPYTSSQSSFQMVNGHTSSSSSVTFTYTLYAGKHGTFTIPPAHALVGGKKLSSKSIQIIVSGSARNNGNAPQMHDDYDDEPQMRAAGSKISGNDLFIKVSANKRRVHEQEPILLTYKVYTTVDLTQLEEKMPDLPGFHTQKIPLPQQKSFKLEKVNGKMYRSVTWSQYVMYPQMTGNLKIPSITFKGVVVQQNRTIDPFEAFFNGGSGYIEVKRNIVAPSLNIQVDALPNRPAGFSGGVGRFNISAQINKTAVKAGEPITLRVVVGGIGNLKLIKQPIVNFPKDFDKYDPKVTDKTRLTVNGVEGNMVYDYLAVPRNQGKYSIPAIEFIYYDTGSNAYKTIKTQPFDIQVAKGDGSSQSLADYSDTKDQDIHGLKTGETERYQVRDIFYGSTAYWVWLLIPLLAFVALLVIFRKRALDHADIVKMRGKKANRIATKRLKYASQLMLQGKSGEFYDEVLRALWGYVGDKLDMSVEKLSRENISENLLQHHVDGATIEKFVNALDECEFERYAPGDLSGNMNRTFESAMTAIMQIENFMNNKQRRHRPSAHLLLLIILMLLPASSFAVTKENADREYQKGNYQQAIKDYQELLKSGVSAALYYNLGNAYYRTDNITQAVLAYERAAMLSPGDPDINFNLQFARSKTIDKITPNSEMFFVTWYHSLVNLTSVDRWASIGIVAIILSLMLVLMYLFGKSERSRKIGFFGASALLILFLLSNVFAYQQKQALLNRRGAIVIATSVKVKKSPTQNGDDSFVIHEGTKVEITDRSMKDWRGIQLTDGREGWLLASQIEEI